MILLVAIIYFCYLMILCPLVLQVLKTKDRRLVNKIRCIKLTTKYFLYYSYTLPRTTCLVLFIIFYLLQREKAMNFTYFFKCTNLFYLKLHSRCFPLLLKTTYYFLFFSIKKLGFILNKFVRLFGTTILLYTRRNKKYCYSVLH